MSSAAKSCGWSFSRSAMIHANIVATSTMMIEYVSLSSPDLRSSFERSMPLVMNGNPGMMNSIEQIYPASWKAGIWNISSAAFSSNAYTRQAVDTDTAMFIYKVKWCLISFVLMRFPIPAATNASIISTGPPPRRNVKAQQARAEASPRRRGEYSAWIFSISSSL